MLSIVEIFGYVIILIFFRYYEIGRYFWGCARFFFFFFFCCCCIFSCLKSVLGPSPCSRQTPEYPHPGDQTYVFYDSVRGKHGVGGIVFYKHRL